MSRMKFMMLALSAGVLVAGCGGSSDEGGDDAPMAVINAENTVAYSKEATLSLNGMAAAGDALNEVMGQLGSLSAGVPGAAGIRKLAKAAAEETYDCPGGGTVTVTSGGDSSSQTVHFVANECTDEFGSTLHGELHVTIGPWDEFPGSESAFEMIMETGSDGLAGDDCEFNGGLVMRLYASQSTVAYGENHFVFEYGTTDEGFIAFCEPDEYISIAANTLVRNDFTYTNHEGGGMTSSNTVSVSGGFEAPDGSGFVTVVAEDLEYGVTEGGESEYGDAMSCPSSGEIRLTGEGGSTASIYFGDDAPAGYAVQVIGPDGFVAEYETCEAFLSATQ